MNRYGLNFTRGGGGGRGPRTNRSPFDGDLVRDADLTFLNLDPTCSCCNESVVSE